MPERYAEQAVIEHDDAYANDFDDGPPETDSVDLHTTIADDGSPVPGQGTDAFLEHPVGDVSELRHRKHLTAQLAARDDTDLDDDDVPVAFDHAVLDAADTALEDDAGLDIASAPVEPAYLYALLLNTAWGFNSIPALFRHLDEHQEIAERIGLTPLPSTSTVYRRITTLNDAGLLPTIREASEHAVHAAWRNSRPIPDAVRDEWVIPDITDDDKYPIAGETRREAIRNWVLVLLDDAVEAFTFERGENASIEIDEFLGACAHSALQNIGLSNGPLTAAWLESIDDMPSGNGLFRYIHSDGEAAVNITEIEAQFRAANEAVLERAEEYGLLDEPMDLPFDTTDKTFWAPPSDNTIGKYRPGTDATPKWRFGLLLSVNDEARFCLGVQLVGSKDRHATVLDELLATATTYMDIELVMADKEFYDGKIVDTLRRHVGPRWVIKAKLTSRIKSLLGTMPEGEQTLIENVSVTSASQPVNVVGIPKRSTGQTASRGMDQSALTDFREPSSTAEASASGVATGEEQGDVDIATDTGDHNGGSGTATGDAWITGFGEKDLPESVGSSYDDRWGAETLMRQFKNELHPVCQSRDPNVRVFLANVSVLFINWHALINRVPSPVYNVLLTVTYHEVLTAIRAVACGSDPADRAW